MLTVTNCGDPPLLENGFFELDTDTTVNSTARYFCNSGDSLRKRVDTAPNEIQCLSNGTWSQLNFDCGIGKSICTLYIIASCVI